MHLRPYPDGLDCVWIASDMNGNVAAFVTGGSGPVPLSALRVSSPPIENVDEAVCELPLVSEALLLVELKRPDDFLDLAKRGFFVYDWTDVHRIERDCTRAYELIAVPVQPVTVDTQPEAIRRLVADNRFAELTFGESSSLDVSALLKCCIRESHVTPVSDVLYRITIDHLDGMTYVPECVVGDVSLESVKSTVNRLDGDTRTMVVLEGTGDTCARLTIGGRQGAYIVLYTRRGADAGWWQLISDGDGRTTLTLVVGGQDGDYPLDVVSDERNMWRAAEYFVTTGEMDPALRWKKD